MKIDHQEIHSSDLDFLESLKSENSNSSIDSFELALDKLAMIYHFIGEIPDDKKNIPNHQIVIILSSFLASSFLYCQAESTPALAQVMQTVRFFKLKVVSSQIKL